MGNTKFEASCAEGGTHHRLARMAGEWEGTYKLWFEPGKLAAESTQRGSIRSVLGGRFLLHEYETEVNGEPVSGVAIYGYHIDGGSWEAAWGESFGTGTQLMYCNGRADGENAGFSVLGSYGDGQGGPDWGWRTEIAQPGDDELMITMYNITPQGEEAKAVETCYRRKS